MINNPKKKEFKEFSPIYKICSCAVHFPEATLPGSSYIEELNNTMTDITEDVFCYINDKYLCNPKNKINQEKVEEISKDVYNTFFDENNKDFRFLYRLWVEDAVLCDIDIYSSNYSVSSKDPSVIQLVKDSKIVEQIVAKYIALGMSKNIQYTHGQLILFIVDVFEKDVPLCLGIMPKNSFDFIIYKGNKEEFSNKIDRYRKQNKDNSISKNTGTIKAPENLEYKDADISIYATDKEFNDFADQAGKKLGNISEVLRKILHEEPSNKASKPKKETKKKKKNKSEDNDDNK